MIGLERPTGPPDALCTKGSVATAGDCASFDSDPTRYQSANARFSFQRSIYAHGSVGTALMAIQSGKCCYCESSLGQSSLNHIEHFRPKGSVRCAGRRSYPGYYWLAYTWENLLLVCQCCNNAKSDKFPLQDESQRARSHRHDLSAEVPLLVNPAAENPAAHIGFEQDAIVGRSVQGWTTIDLLQLNRPQLRERRLATFKMLRYLMELEAALADASEEKLRDMLQQELSRIRENAAAQDRALVLAALAGRG